MQEKRKKIAIIITIFIVLTIVFLEVIHPVFISANKLSCGTYDNFVLMLQNDEYYDVYLDNFNGKLPSKNSEDYRRLTLDMELIYTSVLRMESMQIYVKDIDCENKKNVVMLHDGHLGEETNGGMSIGKEDIVSVFMLVYVGDLTTENEIKDRLEDITKHITYEVMYNMQWLGNRTYTWKKRGTIDNYVIHDETNGGERSFDE